MDLAVSVPHVNVRTNSGLVFRFAAIDFGPKGPVGDPGPDGDQGPSAQFPLNQRGFPGPTGLAQLYISGPNVSRGTNRMQIDTEAGGGATGGAAGASLGGAFALEQFVASALLPSSLSGEGAVISTVTSPVGFITLEADHTGSAAQTRLYVRAGNPNGVLSANFGSICVDVSTPKVWKNNNNTSGWTAL